MGLLGGDKKEEKPEPEPKANLGKIAGGDASASKTFDQDMKRIREPLATRRNHRQ